MGHSLIINGDARSLPLADRSVHCAVTSPPYFGLRSYGIGTENGEIGLEATPSEFVDAMVGVFREVRRVLRDDGVCFINLGDSYASGQKGSGGTGKSGLMRDGREETRRSITADASNGRAKFDVRQFDLDSTGLKRKDLIGIPWRVALALQADGWYLRSDIIWAKPNPMPESVTDRPTKSHEYVFLLSKRERYFWDAEAVREKGTGIEWNAAKSTLAANGIKNVELNLSGQRRTAGADTHHEDVDRIGRNMRSVLTIPTESFPGSHFATFPRRLVEPCVKAGTSQRGVCPGCGGPWVRETEGERVATRPGLASKVYLDPPVHPDSPARTHAGDVCGNRDPGRHCTVTRTIGWRPSCRCPAHDPMPATVLDPFAGSGTTGVVATGLGRRFVGVDLSPKYCRMADRRINRPHAPKEPKKKVESYPLFDREG